MGDSIEEVYCNQSIMVHTLIDGTFYEILTFVDIYIFSVLFKLLYLPQGLHYQHPTFTTLYHTFSLLHNCTSTVPT